jgi:hypothetical protein
MASELVGAASRWAAPGPGVPEAPSRQHDDTAVCVICWCVLPADAGSTRDGEFTCFDCATTEHGCPDCRRSLRFCACE